MSIPVVVALLVFIVVIAALTGLWRARGTSGATAQSSIMMVLVVAVAAVLVWFVLRGG